jgi:hypothetical protein
VTQTPEVEVKRASTKRRFPLVAEKGNQRRMAPVMITPAKLRTKILAGEKCLEKKFLIRMRIFIGIDIFKNLSIETKLTTPYYMKSLKNQTLFSWRILMADGHGSGKISLKQRLVFF